MAVIGIYVVGRGNNDTWSKWVVEDDSLAVTTGNSLDEAEEVGLKISNILNVVDVYESDVVGGDGVVDVNAAVTDVVNSGAGGDVVADVVVDIIGSSDEIAGSIVLRSTEWGVVIG